MNISVIFDVLEEISYLESDPFTLTCPILPINSCLITCTNYQSFVEEGEHCAFSISVVHLEPLFLIIGSNITLFGSNFKFQDLLVMLVTILISIGVKNQTPQVRFKIFAGDSMSVSSHEFVDIKFCESLDILEAI